MHYYYYYKRVPGDFNDNNIELNIEQLITVVWSQKLPHKAHHYFHYILFRVSDFTHFSWVNIDPGAFGYFAVYSPRSATAFAKRKCRRYVSFVTVTHILLKQRLHDTYLTNCTLWFQVAVIIIWCLRIGLDIALNITIMLLHPTMELILGILLLISAEKCVPIICKNFTPYRGLLLKPDLSRLIGNNIYS